MQKGDGKSRVFIIAEAGVNHDGDLSKAFALIDAAAQSGADAVKFQTFEADHLTTRWAEQAAYQRESAPTSGQQHGMLQNLELTLDDFRLIKQRCDFKQIEFMSTGYDWESLQVLVGLGLRRIKVPSGEVTNLPFLAKIGSLGLPVILSTGMANLEEVKTAITSLQKGGLARSQLTVLHCTTQYPAPAAEVNLRAMDTMRREFGVAVGYSDHTLGRDIAVAAVALGACVIEKHLTLNRASVGPDHAASLEPAEFSALATAIRGVESALGDGRKQPSPGELENISIVRRSLVAARQIAAGEALTDDNVVAKRPGTGISPAQWEHIAGLPAPRAFERDELIEL